MNNTFFRIWNIRKQRWAFGVYPLKTIRMAIAQHIASIQVLRDYAEMRVESNQEWMVFEFRIGQAPTSYALADFMLGTVGPT